MKIMMVEPSGDICFYFNISQPIESATGPRDSSRAASSQEMRTVAQGTRDGPGAAPGPGGGCRSHEACGGSRAALSQETRAIAVGHVVALELP
jgi:hypothetical protein